MKITKLRRKMIQFMPWTGKKRGSEREKLSKILIQRYSKKWLKSIKISTLKVMKLPR